MTLAYFQSRFGVWKKSVFSPFCVSNGHYVLCWENIQKLNYQPTCLSLIFDIIYIIYLQIHEILNVCYGCLSSLFFFFFFFFFLNPVLYVMIWLGFLYFCTYISVTFRQFWWFCFLVVFFVYLLLFVWDFVVVSVFIFIAALELHTKW